ncbi:galanin receptor type 1-like [Acipenser oxyrinchus oxyrinchus]|uniref:Galanin receptor type 1-like n=1 Tax=Acipenser oxyrinchus oxyrinchus TaxID=40147 RepID=A0AAD8FT53_ACIOX|nr:galanin receptor type 1-like [Acipenser oxyrinchus oxyrinchus]
MDLFIPIRVIDPLWMNSSSTPDDTGSQYLDFANHSLLNDTNLHLNSSLLPTFQHFNNTSIQLLGTWSADPTWPEGPQVLIVPLIFFLVFVFGVVGNTLVIAVLILNKRGKSGSTTNVLILNLSVADLAFLLLCVPFQATIYSLPQWIFGPLLCKFVHYFVTVTMLVSIFTLAAMSIDRYIAVVHHAKISAGFRSRRNAMWGMGVVWALSLSVAAPVAHHQTYVTGYYEAPNSTFCWYLWEDQAQKQTYTAAILVLGYLLPLILISCCYVQVLNHLHKNIRVMSKKSERSKRKTTQTVLAVVALFSFCWLPHHVVSMWADFGYFPLTDASFALRISAHCLAYANSCFNPFIYAFLSENFRRAYREVIHCPRPRPKRSVGDVSCALVSGRSENTLNTTHSTTNM